MITVKGRIMKQKIIDDDIREIYSRDIEWEMFRGKTILITGPNGMLASYLVYMLLFLNEEKGFGIHIIAMARSEERVRQRFGELCNREYFEIVTKSIAEPITINGNVDYIIHAASLASPQYYDVCPVDVLSPNVIGTYNLLNLAKDKEVKGFLLFSTGDVYGKTQGLSSVTEKDMGIVDPLDIHSCYSESKRMAETMCYAFAHQYNVPARMIRIWHTYAPTMDIDKDPRVFASFMKNIIEGNDIEIKSDGTGMRSFCYVADAIAGLFLVMTKGNNGEAYNICNSSQFVSIRELAETLASLRKDKSIKVTWKQRKKDEHYTENTAIGQIPPSNEKLKRLGWETKYPISEGFKRVLMYYS